MFGEAEKVFAIEKQSSLLVWLVIDAAKRFFQSLFQATSKNLDFSKTPCHLAVFLILTKLFSLMLRERAEVNNLIRTFLTD